MIELHVLGPVHVLVDQEAPPPELLWRKHLALLVYLSLSDRPRSRDHLVGLLWPDKADSAARHSLNEALRILRRSLGTDGIRTEGEMVTITAESVLLDLHRFTQAEAAERWEEAASLALGSFLEGFGVPDASGFEDWLSIERTRWSGRIAAALVRHAGEYNSQGAIRESLNLATRALDIDSQNEEAMAIVLQGLALSGERAAALREFERFKSHLSDTLGTAPREALELLADRIRTDQIHPAEVAPNREQPSPEAPLVGREMALGRLTGLTLRVAEKQRFGLGIVLGDEGTGKTRLLCEVAGRARLNGFTVVSTHALPGDEVEGGGGLVPIADRLARAPGVAGARPEAVRTLAQRVERWAVLFPGMKTGSVMGFPQAVGEVLAAAADSGNPILLLLDDVQWLDQETLQAVATWSRDLETLPICCLVAANRSQTIARIDELRNRVGREIDGEVVTVGLLGAGELAALVRQVLPSYGPREIERLVRRLATDSGGVPLLAVELLHAVVDGLEPLGAAWPATMQTMDQTLPSDLPDGVIAAIRVRFRRLGGDAQQALTVLAVVGGRVSVSDLLQMTGWSSDRLHASLDELEWGGWVVSEARGYNLAARIVGEVIARDMVTPGERRRIRDKIPSADP